MKKSVILLTAKIITFLITFIASLFIFSELMNRGNTDMTAKMSDATLPMIYVVQEDLKYNPMHGYTTEMEPAYLRDSITTIDSSRNLFISIEKYDALISKIEYEIRSVDGSRLVEKTVVDKFTNEGDKYLVSLPIKDLLTENEEYTLTIILTLDEEITARYYTRLVKGDEYYMREKLEFVRFFNECTFDADAALDIVKYLESNASGDNTTLGKVNIYSSFKQITWAGLPVEKETEPAITVKELASDTATVHVEYIAKAKVDSDTHHYRIKEYYRVRYTKDRMYLLNFERTMDELFFEKDDVYTDGTIMLGIQSETPEFVESENGQILTLVVEDRLFCVNTAKNNVANLYGFYDNTDIDLRTIYDAHDIKVLSVDEAGNVVFIVYGYMNRGIHEGEVGVAIYYYSSLSNTVEQHVFIPYTKSTDLLRLEVEQMAFISKNDEVCLIFDGNVYMINMHSREYDIIARNLIQGQYKVSDDKHMLLLQNGKDINSATSLTLINLNTLVQSEIEAGEGNSIKPIGFMGEDIVYGIAHNEDILTNLSGQTLFPMYEIRIQDEFGAILKTYKDSIHYVTEAAIEANQLLLTRVTKDEDGNFKDAVGDQILSNEIIKSGKNTVSYPITQNFEKIVQLNLAKKITAKTLKFLAPKEGLVEGSRKVALENSNLSEERYYVYGLNGIVTSYIKASDAVKLAQEISGVVLGKDGQYLWRKVTRRNINQILSIEAAEVMEEQTTMSVCLDTILKLEGVIRNTALMLNEGENAMSVLKECLPDYTIMDLSGCKLESMLYYINLDIPVLVITPQEEALIIVGYNTTQLALMDPAKGTIYKESTSKLTEKFENEGYRFITYMK